MIRSWFECPDQWEIWVDKVATACHHPYLSPSLRALGQDLQNRACSPGTAPQFLVGVVEVKYEWDRKNISPKRRSINIIITLKNQCMWENMSHLSFSIFNFVYDGLLGHLNVERVKLGQEQVQLPQLHPFYIFDSLFLRQWHPN